MTITREMQHEMATRLAEKGYFTTEQANGFKKRGNKGMLAEMKLVEKLNINTTFDNKQGADLTIKGKKIQFKYMGLGSSPSVTETKKKPTESKQDFINRIVDEHYKEVDEFWIYIDNDLEIHLERLVKLSINQFKDFLRIQNIKDNKKIRLSHKKELYKHQY